MKKLTLIVIFLIFNNLLISQNKQNEQKIGNLIVIIYGFSNNVKGLYGPPSLDKTKFLFNKQDMQIEIKFN